MAFGPFFFIILAALAFILLVVGLTTFLWLPMLIVALLGLLWVPVVAIFRAGAGGSPSRQPSGVPSTSEASYDPVQDPQH